jgi:hypothetical protein
MKNPSLKYGLLAFAAMVGYFLLMELIGLSRYTWLRGLNVIIITGAVYFAIKALKKNRNGDLSYFKGFAQGPAVGAISGSLFFVFLVIYFSINPDFIQYIQSTTETGFASNKYFSSAFVFFECVATGVVSGLIWMQIEKVPFLKDEHRKEIERQKTTKDGLEKKHMNHAHN